MEREREYTTVTYSHALFDKPNGLLMDELYRSVWPGLICQQGKGKEEAEEREGVRDIEQQRRKQKKSSQLRIYLQLHNRLLKSWPRHGHLSGVLPAGPHHRSIRGLHGPCPLGHIGALLQCTARRQYSAAPGFGVTVNGRFGGLFRHGWCGWWVGGDVPSAVLLEME